jgi:hypothetical protein
MKHYKAPWGRSLVVMTSLATIICAGVGFGFLLYGAWIIGSLVLAIIPVCALFTIRGYTITPDAIVVDRLFWQTRLPLDGLESVDARPDAMRKSYRTFGNGGFFAFTGCYSSKELGSYRAFVTDLKSTVLLKFETRTVVLSPNAPEEFAREIEAIVKRK